MLPCISPVEHNSHMKAKGFVALLVGAMVMAGAHAQIDSSRVMVKVNGEEINAGEYYSRMEFLPGVGRFIGQDNFEESPPGILTLQLLIEERVIMQCARENNVYPSKEQIDEMHQNRVGKNPEYLKKWLAMGLTEAGLRYQSVIEACQFNLITKGILVTDQEVDKYYNGNKREFTTPRMMKLSVLVVSEENKTKAEGELSAGKAFADVVKQYSEDVTKTKGGALGEVEVEQFTDAIQKALDSVKIGQSTEWIRGETKWVRFLKEGVTPSALKPLDTDLRKFVRRKLMLDKGQVKNDLASMLRETRKKVRIEVVGAPFKNELQRLINSYKIGMAP